MEQVTKKTFQVKAGSLVPALHRLEERGALVSKWGDAHGHRVKYYELTKAGRRQVESETAGWNRIVDAVARLIDATS
jgi:DNA-binding PadR family transcriptional regulator